MLYFNFAAELETTRYIDQGNESEFDKLPLFIRVLFD